VRTELEELERQAAEREKGKGKGKRMASCGGDAGASNVDSEGGVAAARLDVLRAEQASADYMSRSKVRVCARCGNGVLKSGGCDKMKCRCGYRFCYQCGIAEAACYCTPVEHGFIDNVTGGGDFKNIKRPKNRKSAPW
jgi:hypothetical protein